MSPQATESSLIAEAADRFFAAGGTIKRREVVEDRGCVLARVVEVSGSGEILRAAPFAPVVGHYLSPRELDMVTRQGKSEAQRNADSVRRKSDRDNRRMAKANAACAKARRDIPASIPAKLTRIIAAIGGDWTCAKISQVADREKMKVKRLREFLRLHGRGHLLPADPHAARVAPGIDVSERNAAIIRQLRAGVDPDAIAASSGLSRGHVARIGRGSRPDMRGRQPKCDPAFDTDCADRYMAGESTEDIAKSLQRPSSAIYDAIKRGGGVIRDAVTARALADAKRGVDTRRERVLAMHQEGQSAQAIATALGYANRRSVERMLARWRKTTA